MKIEPNNSNGYSQQDIYLDEFDFSKFKDVYDRDVDDIRWYVEKCTRNNDIRKNQWAGKSDDLKKNREDAFPYQYASDTEVFTTDRSIQNGVALCMNAMNRSQIRAYPRESSDAERAAEVSVMLKWMRDSGIEPFQREMEMAASFWFEKGIAVTYCGGYSKNQSITKTYDLEEIQNSIPELPPVQQMEAQEFLELLSDEERVDELVEYFNQIDGWIVNKKRLKKALKQLRQDGVAEIPFALEGEWGFDVRTLPPDADFIAPAYVMNIQESPRIHMRMLLTGQDLINYRENKDWDESWVQHMIENHTGMSKSEFNTPHGTLGYDRYGTSRKEGSRTGSDARDFIEVVFTYERLIDEEDGAEGIYLTVWSPRMQGEVPDVQSYAYRKLQSGMRQYPFVVTPLTYEAKTLYESTTWPEILRAPQKTQKVLRDHYIDESEWSISPAMWAPPGVDLGQAGPGARMNGPVGRKPEFIDKPQNFAPNERLDDVVEREAMQHIGQLPNDPLSETRQRHYMDAFLRRHVQRVLAMCYEVYKLEGPDELYFRVTGKPEGQTFIKNTNETAMDICVSFNSTYEDPEQLEKLVTVVETAQRMNPSGRIGADQVTDWLLSAADPMLADMVLQPEAAGSARITDETLDDIQRMSAGIPVGARQGAPEARLQVINDYIQRQMGLAQQGVQTQYAIDQQFQFLMQEYAKQYQFAVQQDQNAVIGRLGTTPAQMGSTMTQGVQNA